MEASWLNTVSCLLCFVVSVQSGKVEEFSPSYCSGLTSACYVGEEALKFFVLGDFGGQTEPPYVTDKQLRVARGMAYVDRARDCKFFVSTGDNFYQNGVASDTDIRFQETFEKVYNDPAHQKPWYLIAGNHDYLGNVTAEMAYSRKSWRWIFPDKYYKFAYSVKNKFVAEFLMIDTVVLCGNIFDSQDLIPPGPGDYLAAEREWAWIEQNLRQSSADYLFIVGHYPVRSKGRQGKSTGCVQPRMELLMRKYRASAYISGHDHNLQHYEYRFNEIEPSLNYVVSGMAAVHDDVQIPVTDDGARSLFFFPQKRGDRGSAGREKDADKGGFVVGTLNRRRGSFAFYNGDGDKLYSFFFAPRNV